VPRAIAHDTESVSLVLNALRPPNNTNKRSSSSRMPSSCRNWAKLSCREPRLLATSGTNSTPARLAASWCLVRFSYALAFRELTADVLALILEIVLHSITVTSVHTRLTAELAPSDTKLSSWSGLGARAFPTSLSLSGPGSSMTPMPAADISLVMARMTFAWRSFHKLASHSARRLCVLLLEHSRLHDRR